MDYLVHKAVELSALSRKIQDDQTEHIYIISPKYDGCQALFYFEGGKYICCRSRTGEFVLSMDHIGRSLVDHYGSYLLEVPTVICGEAWIPGQEFHTISGAFRRHSPQPQLGFVPFDKVYNLPTGLTCTTPYRDRLSDLVNYRTEVPSLVLRPKRTEVFGTLAYAYDQAVEAAKHFKSLTDQGYFDGVVLARADGTYKAGAGKGGEFIKVKPLLSETVKVTAVVSDIGGKTGKNTCVLMFELDGQIQKVSTGLTQAQADEYAQYPENIIGKYIEVEAMGRTATDLLREPRFKGIRTDV